MKKYIIGILIVFGVFIFTSHSHAFGTGFLLGVAVGSSSGDNNEEASSNNWIFKNENAIKKANPLNLVICLESNYKHRRYRTVKYILDKTFSKEFRDNHELLAVKYVTYKNVYYMYVFEKINK